MKGNFGILQLRYKLRTLLIFVSVTGMALGLFVSLGLYVTAGIVLVASIISSCCGWHGASTGFRACLLLLFLLFAIAFVDVFFIESSYIRWYNMSLYSRASAANLIGAPEHNVEDVLGRASFKSSGWTMTDMETGDPVDNATYSTTYAYAPYPCIPYQRFEVHCRDQKVISIEMYQD